MKVTRNMSWDCKMYCQSSAKVIVSQKMYGEDLIKNKSMAKV